MKSYGRLLINLWVLMDILWTVLHHFQNISKTGHKNMKKNTDMYTSRIKHELYSYFIYSEENK